MYFAYSSDSICSQLNFFEVKAGFTSGGLVRTGGAEVVSTGGAVTGKLVFGRLGVAAANSALVTALVLLELGKVVEITEGWPLFDKIKYTTKAPARATLRARNRYSKLRSRILLRTLKRRIKEIQPIFVESVAVQAFSRIVAADVTRL